MDFRVRQLQCFLTLADLLNYGKTARVLYMSQPTITFQIQSLEEAFGVKLFERDRKQVRLTAAGETLRVSAQTIMDTIGEAQAQLKTLGAPRPLRITCGPAGLPEFLPSVLRTLTRHHVGIDIEVVELTTEEQIEQMADHKVDAMIMTPRQPIAGATFTPLCSMEVRAIISRQNPLASRKAISVQDMDGANVLTSRPQDCRFHPLFLSSLFEPYNVFPKLIEIPQAHSVQLAYAAADVGILVRAHSGTEANFEDVVSIPFIEPLPLIELGVAVQEENNKPSLLLFQQVLTHCAARFEQRNALRKIAMSDRSRVIQFPQLRDAV